MDTDIYSCISRLLFRLWDFLVVLRSVRSWEHRAFLPALPENFFCAVPYLISTFSRALLRIVGEPGSDLMRLAKVYIDNDCSWIGQIARVNESWLLEIDSIRMSDGVTCCRSLSQVYM